MVKNIYEEFIVYLQQEDREKAVNFVLNKLQTKEIDIVNLYTKILAPSLNSMACDVEDKRICVWREHVRSSIIRTIIENCYPYVMKERREIYKYDNNYLVFVVCPMEEYHEIGARMVTDFFTLCGCKAIFVGSNTPFEDIINAVDILKPDFVALSVTNYYNLVHVKRIIDEINKEKTYKIVLGGNAFKNNKELVKELGAYKLIDSFDDIKKLVHQEVG